MAVVRGIAHGTFCAQAVTDHGDAGPLSNRVGVLFEADRDAGHIVVSDRDGGLARGTSATPVGRELPNPSFTDSPSSSTLSEEAWKVMSFSVSPTLKTTLVGML